MSLCHKILCVNGSTFLYAKGKADAGQSGSLVCLLASTVGLLMPADLCHKFM